MKTVYITALIAAISSPPAALAQFVPTLRSDGSSVCPEQPAQPDWIENINIREAHKGHLVQMMYRAEGLLAVSETGSCTCNTRFPSWEGAQEYFYEHYADMERWEVLKKTSEYRKTVNEHSNLAKSICEQEGNW